MNTTRNGVPPSASEDFVAWNEAMAERYDIERYYERSHPVVRWVEARRLVALTALAAPEPGDRVLEVGCGAGHVLERFGGTRRSGVDLSTGMLARARRRLGPGVRLLRARAEKLPFADGAFDVVLCTEVLEHTPDPERVMRELLRVGAAGARIVVSIPNEANIDRAKRALRRVPGLRQWLRSLADTGNEWHLHEFDLRLLRRMVAGAGARLERVRGVPAALLPIRYVARLAPARRSP